MKLKMLCGSIAVAAVLSGPAMAGSEDKFSALQAVEAQALSVEEMRAITGQVNALDIAAALFAEAATLRRFPRLQDSTLRLANYYKANAVQLNATFDKLGILTPCATCK
jgi:hypothetical protein